ncbi:MAG TPA: hypothetical protein VFD04_23845 [Actinomycetes bacterium]|jgi:hypothetical protein|nr:hypothetical protein [Actinomycetes bacterium]
MQEPSHPTEEQVPVYERGPDGGRPRWREWLAAGLVCLVIGAAGGFGVGRATAQSGPKTLAEAIQLAQQGKLPRGNLGNGRFFGGAPGASNGQGTSNGQGSGQGAGNGSRNGAPGFQGQITDVNGDVLTISTPAGNLQVRLTSSTAIRKAVAGKKSDLAVGDTVAIGLDLTGGGNTNGTVTARTVTEEPAQ